MKSSVTDSFFFFFSQFSSDIPKKNLEERLRIRLWAQFWDFPKTSSFPKVLGVKLFGDSWGNSHIQFLVVTV